MGRGGEGGDRKKFDLRHLSHSNGCREVCLKIELEFETRINVKFEILNLIRSLNRVKLEFEGMFGILNLIRNSWSREKARAS